MVANRAIRGRQLARMLASWRTNGRGADGAPRYLALAAAIRGLIVDGRLPLELRLPAERDLADALEISRTTVSAAYATLRDTGFLISRRGSGSYTALPPGYRLTSTGLLSLEEVRSERLDLTCAAPAAPEELTAAVAEAAEELPRYTHGHGYYPMGIAPLREQVARWYTARGLPTTPDQVIITNGAQRALDLALRAFTAPAEPFLMESPTFPDAPAAARAARVRLHSYGIGPDGWDTELLETAVTQIRPRLAYLVPDYHNPTGQVMSEQTRARLVAAAHAAGSLLVVDETFSELRFDGPPLPPPVAAIDRHNRVLSVGSMSKAYWGGLRVGWIRGAPSLLARLVTARATVDLATAVLDQLVAYRLLEDERRENILRARRQALRAARDTVTQALRQRLPQWRFREPNGGMSLWIELDAPISTALTRAAETHGLRLAPGPRFAVDGTLEHFLRLPLSPSVQELTEAIERLANAAADVEAGTTASWPTPLVVA